MHVCMMLTIHTLCNVFNPTNTPRYYCQSCKEENAMIVFRCFRWELRGLQWENA